MIVGKGPPHRPVRLAAAVHEISDIRAAITSQVGSIYAANTGQLPWLMAHACEMCAVVCFM